MVTLIVAFWVSTSMFQVLTGALALGLLPALWILIRGQRWRLVIKWSFATVVCIAAAAYALPLALQAWKEAALKNHGWVDEE